MKERFWQHFVNMVTLTTLWIFPCTSLDPKEIARVLLCFFYLKNMRVLLHARERVYMCSHIWPMCVFILCVSVSVCTQHRSETGWTTAAVEGTGKESGGKGVTAACRPPHPLPLPQGAIKHTHHHHHHTRMHTHKQGDHNDKSPGLNTVGGVSCKMSCHCKNDKEHFGLQRVAEVWL